MSRTSIRIILYTALGIGLVIFGILFSMEYSRRSSHDRTATPLTQPDPDNPEPKTVPLPAEQPNHFMLYLALFLGCGLVLGIMAARDLSEFFGQQAIEYIFNDDGEGQRDPDYEAAEMEVSNGNALEAVRQMRACYEHRPGAVYVALRIAELYELNLNNPLAAALEYEEVLKKKLPDERWGWAAIHLANLYSGKLGKAEQAVTLLHRIVREYPKTGAAKKARERLGLGEDEAAPATTAQLPAGFRPKATEEQLAHSGPASEQVAPVTPQPEPAVAEDTTPVAALPSGFRPKTGAEHVGPASDSAEPTAAVTPEEPTAPKLPPGFRPKDS